MHSFPSGPHAPQSAFCPLLPSSGGAAHSGLSLGLHLTLSCWAVPLPEANDEDRIPGLSACIRSPRSFSSGAYACPLKAGGTEVWMLPQDGTLR